MVSAINFHTGFLLLIEFVRRLNILLLRVFANLWFHLFFYSAVENSVDLSN